MHDQLVVQLDVHDVAKAIACIRFSRVSVAGFSAWHLRARLHLLGLLLLRLLLIRLLLVLLLVLVDTRASVVHGRVGGKAHVAEVAVADARTRGPHTLDRGLSTVVRQAELVAVGGPLVHYGQI